MVVTHLDRGFNTEASFKHHVTIVGMNDVIAYVNTLLLFNSSLCTSKQLAGSYDLLPEELGH